jgi:8-oxo-dGTP pyrophosphatase MutT (NUDIX family)
MDNYNKSKGSRHKNTKDHFMLSDNELAEKRRARDKLLSKELGIGNSAIERNWTRGSNNKENELSVDKLSLTAQNTTPIIQKKYVDVTPYIENENPIFPFIKGAGLIGWRFNGKRLQFLLSRKNGKLDCFGGKVEYDLDIDSAATAAREFVEETSCEPYLYLQELSVPETKDEIKQTLIDAQAFFEPLIRKHPNLVRDGIKWGIYFCEIPDIPTMCFLDREDMLTSNDGDKFTPEWVDIWTLLDANQVNKRLSCLNMIPAIERIYNQVEKQ